jgi:hypothetical protein
MQFDGIFIFNRFYALGLAIIKENFILPPIFTFLNNQAFHRLGIY